MTKIDERLAEVEKLKHFAAQSWKECERAIDQCNAVQAALAHATQRLMQAFAEDIRGCGLVSDLVKPPIAESVPLTLSIPEAGELYYGLSRNGSYAAAKRGDIPTIKVGRIFRVPVRAMDKRLDRG